MGVHLERLFQVMETIPLSVVVMTRNTVRVIYFLCAFCVWRSLSVRFRGPRVRPARPGPCGVWLCLAPVPALPTGPSYRACLCSCVSDISRHINAPPGVRSIRGQPQPCADAGRGHARAVTCSLAKSLELEAPTPGLHGRACVSQDFLRALPSPRPSWMEGEPWR